MQAKFHFWVLRICALTLSVGTTSAQIKYQLPGNLVYADYDKNDQISLEEADSVFTRYFEFRTDSVFELTNDVENTLVDLIAYLEGADLSDIKKTRAARKFIDIYYNARFITADHSAFGHHLGFDEEFNPDAFDTAYKSEPLLPLFHHQNETADRFFSMNGQFTSITQFPLHNNKQTQTATDIAQNWKSETLFLASLPIVLQLPANFKIDITPEYSGGNGIGDGIGIAGYPNANYGYPQSLPYLMRCQVQNEFEFSTKKNHAPRSVWFIAGRFILQEAFEANAWSGNPKRDFLNFNHTMCSAWDAATTAYGYTHGFGAKLSFDKAALNFAAVTVDQTAGGIVTDWNIKEGHSFNAQYSYHTHIKDRGLHFRTLVFANRTFSGKFSDYTPASYTAAFDFPDSLKTYTTKYGFAADIDFDVSETAGIFLRCSASDGKSEFMGYTQADRAINLGFSTFATFFNRQNDLLGCAVSVNDLSQQHINFIKSGGNGFMLGGGDINYGKEMAIEAFYRFDLYTNAEITLNYQAIINPGYNRNNACMQAVAVRFNFNF